MAAGSELIELDAQYRAIREQAGLVERAGRGFVAVAGADAAEYLQGQLSNDVEGLAPGAGCYAALLDRKGHMQADLRVLRLGADEILCDTEPVARERLVRHLSIYKIGRQVAVEDVSSGRALLSVLGPAAAAVCGAAPAAAYAHVEAELGGARVRAVGTEIGIDLICAAADRDAVGRALLQAGAVGVSEDAAEIARVESGLPRYGAEMTEATIPAEAGLDERAVDFEKGCYIGQETVARLHYKGKPNRHLRGLRLSAPVDAGAELRLGEREVGRVGTAVVSPRFGPIALAIVRREAGVGDELAVGADGATAEVVELPFGR